MTVVDHGNVSADGLASNPIWPTGSSTRP